MLVVDEVLRGGSLGYFIGLIRAGGGEDYYLFDNILYKERYSIERTNALLDSYRSLLNRFEVTLISWQSMLLYSIYCYSDEESEKESKFKISSSLFKFQSTHLME